MVRVRPNYSALAQAKKGDMTVKNRLQQNRMPRIRIIPITMMMAFLLFMIKTVDIYHGSQTLTQMLIAGNAVAAEEKPAEEHAAEEKGDDEHGSGNDVELASLEETPDPAAQRDRQQFTQIELDLLQSLSERREALDTREKEVELKEKLLQATEIRINDKISEIKSLQKKVEELLAKYEGHEDEQIASLVKIYENMKPKDAAQIFNEMDMDILLEVIAKMSERKVAPILAGMSPTKATQVTAELAEMRKLKPSAKMLEN